MSTTNIPENHEPGPPLGLGSSEELGPNVPKRARRLYGPAAERAERQREREAEELETALAGLSHEEIMARLLNPKEPT